MNSIADPNHSISILIVEDEEINLELLATVLARKYPELVLHTANNGRNGWELFNAHTPEIVITDVIMPEMDGVQLARKIRELKPGTKFIVLTGDRGKLEYQDSIETGFEFDHLIVKPVGFKELFAAIEQCLNDIAGRGKDEE